jgi:hypothetical protein
VSPPEARQAPTTQHAHATSDPSHPSRTRRPLRGALAAAGAVVIAVAIFAAGRLSAPPPAPVSSARAARASIAERERRAWAVGSPGAAAPAPAASTAAAGPAPAAGAAAADVKEAVAAAPDVKEAVAAEARARLESLRGYISSRCWPEGGLPGGQQQTTLRLDLTFDRDGREIARGIRQDRRAPAAAFTACLRRLPGTRLEVSAPGRSVGVLVAMQFP